MADRLGGATAIEVVFTCEVRIGFSVVETWCFSPVEPSRAWIVIVMRGAMIQ